MIEKVETMETVNINVLIAERVYPLKVTKQDEEKVKQAVNLVNEKIKQHQTRYAGKDKQDYMAMCLFNFAIENLNAADEKQQNDRFISKKLTELDKALSSVV